MDTNEALSRYNNIDFSKIPEEHEWKAEYLDYIKGETDDFKNLDEDYEERLEEIFGYIENNCAEAIGKDYPTASSNDEGGGNDDEGEGEESEPESEEKKEKEPEPEPEPEPEGEPEEEKEPEPMEAKKEEEEPEQKPESAEVSAEKQPVVEDPVDEKKEEPAEEKSEKDPTLTAEEILAEIKAAKESGGKRHRRTPIRNQKAASLSKMITQAVSAYMHDAKDPEKQDEALREAKRFINKMKSLYGYKIPDIDKQIEQEFKRATEKSKAIRMDASASKE